MREKRLLSIFKVSIALAVFSQTAFAQNTRKHLPVNEEVATFVEVSCLAEHFGPDGERFTLQESKPCRAAYTLTSYPLVNY